MQKPSHGLVWRIVDWMLVPLQHPEYRRLLLRSYVLTARLELLRTVSALIAPFATPVLLRLMRGWLDRLHEDVAEFARVVRMRRAMLPLAPATLQPGNEGGFQNPWT